MKNINDLEKAVAEFDSSKESTSKRLKHIDWMGKKKRKPEFTLKLGIELGVVPDNTKLQAGFTLNF